LKNTLIYIPSGLPSPELEILLSKAQSSIDKRDNTIIATCRGGLGYACSYNIYSLPSICFFCKLNRERAINALTGKYEIIESPQIRRKSQFNVITSDIKKLKSYEYHSVDVGQASYSSYLATTRDQNLEGVLSKYSISKLLATSEILVDWFGDLIKTHKISEIILYNGRQNQYRPLLRLGVLNKVSTVVMEFCGQTDKNVYLFKNRMPQDLSALYEYINKEVEKFKGNITQCAKNYYEVKRSGGKVNDNKSYVLNQSTNLIPKNFDKTKHNIAIFNSSEDEFSALGGEYDETLYKNQFDAITKICQSLHAEKDIHIWLRIHPNLGSVKWSFAKKLLLLEKNFKNVTVIKANSKVSSYALLDASSKIISFGSTMGVEAAYSGKPSILLARCIYEKLGSVYVPKSHAEVIKLLQNRQLKPLSKIGSYKTAIFWTYGGQQINYFRGNRTVGFTFNGIKIEKQCFELYIYYLAKAIEKLILNSLINYNFKKFYQLIVWFQPKKIK
jgi:hypothetical protein